MHLIFCSCLCIFQPFVQLLLDVVMLGQMLYWPQVGKTMWCTFYCTSPVIAFLAPAKTMGKLIFNIFQTNQQFGKLLNFFSFFIVFENHDPSLISTVKLIIHMNHTSYEWIPKSLLLSVKKEKAKFLYVFWILPYKFQYFPKIRLAPLSDVHCTKAKHRWKSPTRQAVNLVSLWCSEDIFFSKRKTMW